jgi:hypothetical protein
MPDHHDVLHRPDGAVELAQVDALTASSMLGACAGLGPLGGW